MPAPDSERHPKLRQWSDQSYHSNYVIAYCEVRHILQKGQATRSSGIDIYDIQALRIGETMRQELPDRIWVRSCHHADISVAFIGMTAGSRFCVLHRRLYPLERTDQSQRKRNKTWHLRLQLILNSRLASQHAWSVVPMLVCIGHMFVESLLW